MYEAWCKMGPAKDDIRSTDSENWKILKLLVFSVLISEVSAWTYHNSNITMTWNEAREWCKTKYTNMVFIRNKNESMHLNETMTQGTPYHWIGIKKGTNGTWIWEETKKTIPEDEQSWAEGEPSNGANEKCVELYIKRPKDSGKWNNDGCGKKKRPLCYQDSCMNSTCSHHGECIEDIGSYTCVCYSGFYGNNCEHVESCMDLQRPEGGSMRCSDIYGEFKYKSICNVSCDNGFRLHGSKSSECQSTRQWSNPIHTCLAVSCVDLQIPANGKINCTDEYGKFQYKSFCNFSCDKGYELNGTKSVFCQNTGEWSETTPTCFAVSCVDLQIPANGKINCTNEYGKFQYNSFCNFSCDKGYELNGTKSVFCQNTGEWSETTPTCLASNVSVGEQKQVSIVSSVLGTVGLFSSSIPIAFILRYLKKKKESSLIIKTKKKRNGLIGLLSSGLTFITSLIKARYH